MAVGGGIVGAGGAVGKAGVGAVGTVGKAGVQGVGTVGKGVGKGVGAVGKGVFGIGRRAVGGGHGRSASVASFSELAALGDDAGYAVGGAGAEGVEVLASDMAVGSPVVGAGAAMGSAAPAGMGAEGTLTLTLGQLTGGGGEGEKKAVVVKLEGGKTVLETHSHRSEANVIAFGETATVKTPASGPVDLTFSVVHKKTLGSDKVLSSATLSVWQHVSPLQPNTTVALPLAGAQGGELVVSLSVRAPYFSLCSRKVLTSPNSRNPQWIATPPFLSSGGSRAPSEADARSIADSTMGGTPTKTRSRFSSGRFGRRDKEASPAPA